MTNVFERNWVVMVVARDEMRRGQVAVCAGTKRVQMSVWFTGA